MKRRNKSKSESGAVAVISLFVMTTLILLTAMVIDYGLFNYKGNKLQNAVDAAATAVAANLDSSSATQEQIARNYLAKNGFDGDNIEITIEQKGVLDEATAHEDDYITSGYMKVTADINEGMIFSEVLNKDSMRLIKTAYAKCDANYDEKVPEALKYTLIAGTSNGTRANPAMQINGRTGDVTNMLNSMLEQFINGVNESLVQPIKEFFGLEGDYTDLVHINLSEAVTNGDVHSNSNIFIGVQAVNTSRTKDDGLEVVKKDENGNPIQKVENGVPVTKEEEVVKKDENGNPIPVYELDSLGNKLTDENGEFIVKKDADGNTVYETETVTVPVYEYEQEYENFENNGADDYGQVTYTAVDSIEFTNTSADSSTHAYTQNQQYLEQTQVVLNVLNNLDFGTITSINNLKTAFTEGAETYFDSHPGISAERQEFILDQVDNLSYDASTKTVTLSNQSMVVYDISNDTANAMIQLAERGDSSLEDIYTTINLGYDPIYADNGSSLLFSGTADKEGTINYSVVLEKNEINTAEATVNISGVQVNRDFDKTGIDMGETTNSTWAGATYSVMNTFRANLGEDGYIVLPNLKPYFVREVNQSIRNATKTKEELGDSEVKGQTTVKNAVKNLGENLENLLNSISFTDNTYKDYNSTTNEDGTVVNTPNESLKNNSQSQLFTKFKKSSTSGLTDLTGDKHTSYKGFNLYNEDGTLKNPTDYINEYAGVVSKDYISEFAQANITESNSKDEGNYGVGAYNKYYNSVIVNNGDDSEKYPTNYAGDAVQKKRDQLENEFKRDGYDERNEEVENLKDDFRNKAPIYRYILTSNYRGDIPRYILSYFMPEILGNSVTMNLLTPDLDNRARWADGTIGTKICSNEEINNNSNNSTSISSGSNRICKNQVWVKNKNLNLNTATTLIAQNGINLAGSDEEGWFGSITEGGRLQIGDNSVIYCFGDINCYKLEMGENSKIYCTGTITVRGNVETKSTSVIIANGMSINATNEYNNDGSYYCFGNFTNSADAYFFGNGKLYAYGDITVSGTLTAANGFKIISEGTITATNITATTDDADPSIIRGLESVVINSGGKFTVKSTSENRSEIFCGEDTEIPATCSYDIGGDIYFPAVSDSVVLTPITFDIRDYGEMYIENDVQFSWIGVYGSGKLYVKGASSLENCYLAMSGKAYFLGGLDVTNAYNNPDDGDDREIEIQSDTADLFIGENEDGNLTFNSYYWGKGNVYIENNFNVLGKKALAENFIPNRGETFVITSGNTYVSGDTSVSIEDGVYVGENCSFSTGGRFYFGSAIYNLGKFIVYGDLEADESSTYYSDRDDSNYMNEGISIANGGKSGVTSAFMYVGGSGETHIRGYLVNYGKLLHNGTLHIDGYRIPDDKQFEIYIDREDYWTRYTGNSEDVRKVAPHIGISNYKNAELHCVGDINVCAAIYNYENSKLSAQGHIYYGMALMNGGEFIAVDGVSYSDDRYQYDYIEIGGSNENRGYSIVNGYNSYNPGLVNAVFYAGENSYIETGGMVENYGKFYLDGELNVQGFVNEFYVTSCKTAVVNRDNAQMYVNGNVYANSNAVFSGVNSVFDCKGNLEYAICLYNEGQMTVTGHVTNDESKTVNSDKISYRDDDNFSLRNGYDLNNNQYQNAILYAGGGIRLGVSEHGNANAGTLQNGGTMYCGGDCFVFTNEKNCHNKNAFLGQVQSNTFIAGDYFGGGGTTTMNNSIFMVGDDFHSKRATKINTDDSMQFKIDNYELCYVYVGGNMLVNTIGYDLDGNNNPFRSFDIYSNANIYVGGSVYTNSILNMCQNVTFVIAGNKNFDDEFSSDSGIINGNDMNGDGKITANDIIRKGVADSKNIDTWLYIGNYVNQNYKLVVTQSINNGKESVAILGLIGYGDSGIGSTNQCSTLIVNGSAFVRDTCKLRDMDKTYIYGDFVCTDYVEIGKALDGKDETEAKSDLFKEEGENDNDYEFANAGYMYVGGDYYSQKYNKVYASTTLKVMGNYENGNYLTLRHDANVYVGKNLKVTNSVDAGSYSQLFVGGNLKATLSTIKIRDNVTCFVGGSMTALSYIELGKFGDYTRNIVSKVNMSAFPNPEDENSTYKSGYLYRDDSTGRYYYYSALDKSWKEYEYNSEVVDALEGDGGNYDGDEGELDGNTGETGNEGNQGVEEGGSTEVVIGDTTTIDTEQELSSDDSDLANGSTIYIGKVLASYTSYIKEFAYSQVSVGNYVFAPDYITLRHNADLWVMPETFNNDTYTQKIYPDPENIWQAIVTELNKLVDTFTPKNGSIYTLGELTLNKNASLMGTWDCVIQGKCTLRQDSLVYMGHNFNLTAPSLNLSWDAIQGKETVCGFDSYGTSTGDTSFPVVVYADNEINIMTTAEMKLTYLVANRGDVNLYDIYSRSENAELNAKALPNAICSYSGDVNYFSMYGKLGALMYAPNGNLDIDGYYVEIWGSGVADTIETNTYYLSMHRFTNWRTLDLHLATSGSVYLVSETEFVDAEDNVDDIFMFDTANSDETSDEDFVKQGADLFFDFD